MVILFIIIVNHTNLSSIVLSIKIPDALNAEEKEHYIKLWKLEST